MPKRLTRILVLDAKEGTRVRLCYERGVMCFVADEMVWPEKVNSPDAAHVSTNENFDLTLPIAIWLREALDELIPLLEKNE
jgi:hypothetical protein